MLQCTLEITRASRSKKFFLATPHADCAILGKTFLRDSVFLNSPELGWLTNYAITYLGHADEWRIVNFEKKGRLRDLVARHIYVHCKSSHFHGFEADREEAIILGNTGKILHWSGGPTDQGFSMHWSKPETGAKKSRKKGQITRRHRIAEKLWKAQQVENGLIFWYTAHLYGQCTVQGKLALQAGWPYKRIITA